MENRGTRGRPKGFDKIKYWRVLQTLLHGPLSFNEIVSSSGLSRRFVSKVLKDALMKDIVSVNYGNHKAIYFLKCDAFAIPSISIDEDGDIQEMGPSELFDFWWSLGRPNLLDFIEKLDKSRSMEYFSKLEFAAFLYSCYPHLKIDDPMFWENRENLPSKLLEERDVSFKKLYRIVNHDIKKRKKIILEDLVLTRVINAFFQKRVCPICFRRGETFLLEKIGDVYVCRNRQCSYNSKQPWKNSKIYDEFSEWWKQRAVIKLGRIKLLM